MNEQVDRSTCILQAIGNLERACAGVNQKLTSKDSEVLGNIKLAQLTLLEAENRFTCINPRSINDKVYFHRLNELFSHWKKKRACTDDKQNIASNDSKDLVSIKLAQLMLLEVEYRFTCNPPRSISDGVCCQCFYILLDEIRGLIPMIVYPTTSASSKDQRGRPVSALVHCWHFKQKERTSYRHSIMPLPEQKPVLQTQSNEESIIYQRSSSTSSSAWTEKKAKMRNKCEQAKKVLRKELDDVQTKLQKLESLNQQLKKEMTEEKAKMRKKCEQAEKLLCNAFDDEQKESQKLDSINQQLEKEKREGKEREKLLQEKLTKNESYILQLNKHKDILEQRLRGLEQLLSITLMEYPTRLVGSKSSMQLEKLINIDAELQMKSDESQERLRKFENNSNVNMSFKTTLDVTIQSVPIEIELSSNRRTLLQRPMFAHFFESLRHTFKCNVDITFKGLCVKCPIMSSKSDQRWIIKTNTLQNVLDYITSFLSSQLTHRTIECCPQIWEEMKSFCTGLEMDESVAVLCNNDALRIEIDCLRDTGTTTIDEIFNYVRLIEQRLRRTSENVQYNELQIRLLTGIETFKYIPTDTRITPRNGGFTIEGQPEDIQHVKEKAQNAFQQITQANISNSLSENCMRFLRNNLLNDFSTTATFRGVVDSFQVYTIDKYLTQTIVERDLFVDSNDLIAIQTEKFQALTKTLKQENWQLVDWQMEGIGVVEGKIHIFGLKQHVEQVCSAMQSFFAEHFIRLIFQSGNAPSLFMERHNADTFARIRQTLEAKQKSMSHMECRQEEERKLRLLLASIVNEQLTIEHIDGKEDFEVLADLGKITEIEDKTRCIIQSRKELACTATGTSSHYNIETKTSDATVARNSPHSDIHTSTEDSAIYEGANENKDGSSIKLMIWSDSAYNINECIVQLGDMLRNAIVTFEIMDDSVKDLQQHEIDRLKFDSMPAQSNIDLRAGIITIHGDIKKVAEAKRNLKYIMDEKERLFEDRCLIGKTVVKSQLCEASHSNDVYDGCLCEDELELRETEPINAMGNLVDISRNDPVYQSISQRFISEMESCEYTCLKEKGKLVDCKPGLDDLYIDDIRNAKIKKIQKIENQEAYAQYEDMKRQLKMNGQHRPANMPLERALWHGTNNDAKDGIIQHGFKTSFAGKNGALPWYGKGIYFSRDASYSAQTWLSGANCNGKDGYIFLVNVLTGQYCQGEKNMQTPPPVDIKYPSRLFDSVVDDVKNPMEFCIFKDAQAYPEYLLTFSVTRNPCNMM